MRILKIFLSSFLFTIAFTSNAQSTSGNAVRAKIREGIYSERVADSKSMYFSVRVPQYENHYEYVYTTIQDWRNDMFTEVNFGPAALDLSCYRVVMIKKEPTWGSDLKKYAKATLKYFYSDNLKYTHLLAEKSLNFQGHKALYIVYAETFADQDKLIKNHGKPVGGLTHGIYFINYKDYLGILWTTASSRSHRNKLDVNERSKMINQTWQPQKDLIQSFHVYNE